MIVRQQERRPRMINPEYYKFPQREQPRRELTDEERRQAAETLEYLESLPWRPHGMEW